MENDVQQKKNKGQEETSKDADETTETSIAKWTKIPGHSIQNDNREGDRVPCLEGDFNVQQKKPGRKINPT